MELNPRPLRRRCWPVGSGFSETGQLEANPSSVRKTSDLIQLLPHGRSAVAGVKSVGGVMIMGTTKELEPTGRERKNREVFSSSPTLLTPSSASSV